MTTPVREPPRCATVEPRERLSTREEPARAARHDRSRPDGCEHGAAANARRPRVRRLQPQPETGRGSSSARVPPARDPSRSSCRKLEAPRFVWLMVPAAVVDGTLADLVPLLSPGDTLLDGGNGFYHDDIRRAAELGQGLHYLDVGTSAAFGLERGDCLMIGGDDEPVARLEPCSPRWPRPRRPRARRAATATRAGRARLAALRAGGRRALREDGAQRHRVRDDGRLRRGPERAAPRGRRASRAHDRRCRDDAAAHPEQYQYRFDLGRGHRGVASRQRRRVVAARPDGASPSTASRRSRRLRRVRSPTRVKGGGRRGRHREGIPVPVLARRPLRPLQPRAARPSSRTESLSAMRFAFGGHLEREPRRDTPCCADRPA